MKWNYLIIPLVTVLVSVIGGQFTSGGTGSGWYGAIVNPSWTPPGSVIGAVWTVIFILTTISALIVWNRVPRDTRFWWIVGILLLNAVLNVLWSYLFFDRHLMGWAVLEAAALDLTVIALMVLIWPLSRIASLLLLPYAGWVAFATYLTHAVWSLNR
jgi:tryptophan-rich sensory protein